MEILLGGLVSILTLIVTKVYEVKQKKLEHKFSLESQFFSKQIEAAEIAVLSFSNELSLFNQDLVIHEKLVGSKLEEYPFLLKQRELMIKDSEQFQSIENSFGKAYLYFDIEGYILSDNDNYKRYIEIHSEMEKIHSEIRIQNKLLEMYKGDKLAEDLIFKNILEKAKEYIPKLKEMIELLKKAKEEAFENISIIKKQMKKYQPK